MIAPVPVHCFSITCLSDAYLFDMSAKLIEVEVWLCQTCQVSVFIIKVIVIKIKFSVLVYYCTVCQVFNNLKNFGSVRIICFVNIR